MSTPDTETHSLPTLQSNPAAVEASVDETGIKNSDSLPRPIAKTSGKGLYSVVWRWHFYAGLFVAPVFLVLTVTGALYVFKHELVALRDHHLQVVTPQSERVSHDVLMQTAEEHFAPHEVEGMVVFPEANRSVKFIAHVESESGDHHDDQHHLLYMNPYNGEILGEQIEEHDFFHIVLDLHRRLMLGTTGRAITELVTSWGILLLATGVFLWWPRGKKNVGVWVPRIRGKLYAVLRDWHAVLGIYLLPFAALIIGTGLFFSVVLGATFNKSVKSAGQWADEWFSKPVSAPHVENAQPASLDDVVATLIPQSLPHDSISIRMATDSDAAHQAWLLQDENKNSYRMIIVDQYTGQLSKRVDANQLPFLYRVRLWAVSIHMGQIFGTVTKVLALLTSFGLIVMTITGIWMWWRRRPGGKTGFPRRPHADAMPKWGWAVIVPCGIILPVAGASMILVGMMDFAVSKFSHSKAP